MEAHEKGQLADMTVPHKIIWNTHHKPDIKAIYVQCDIMLDTTRVARLNRNHTYFFCSSRSIKTFSRTS